MLSLHIYCILKIQIFLETQTKTHIRHFFCLVAVEEGFLFFFHCSVRTLKTSQSAALPCLEYNIGYEKIEDRAIKISQLFRLQHHFA